jgi:hypothetical protein
MSARLNRVPGVRRVSGFSDNVDIYDSGTPVHGFSGGYAQPGVVGTGVMARVVVAEVIPGVAAGASVTGASSATQPAKRIVTTIPAIAMIPNCAGFIRFILFYRIAKCADPKTSVLRLSSLIVVTFTI